MGRYWSTRRAGSQGPPAAVPDALLPCIDDASIGFADVTFSVTLVGGAPAGFDSEITLSLRSSAAPATEVEGAVINFDSLPWEFATPAGPGSGWIVVVSADGRATVTVGPTFND